MDPASPTHKRHNLAAIRTDGGHEPRSRTTSGSGAAPSSSATDAIFSHLQRIQQLQSEITTEHSALENLGTTPSNSMRDLRASESASTGLSASATFANTGNGKVPPPPATHNAESRPSTATGEKKTEPDAYDVLAAGFQERQKGVESIMDKLSQLSKAVKDFHSLPPPVLFPDTSVLKAGHVVDTPVAMSPQQRFR